MGIKTGKFSFCNLVTKNSKNEFLGKKVWNPPCYFWYSAKNHYYVFFNRSIMILCQHHLPCSGIWNVLESILSKIKGIWASLDMSPLIWQINKFNPYLFQNNVDKTTSVKSKFLKNKLELFHRAAKLWVLVIFLSKSTKSFSLNQTFIENSHPRWKLASTMLRIYVFCDIDMFVKKNHFCAC